ncbi:MAG: aminoacyl-histidine dipeptidase [Lachnospiraceae bacterium]|nr:aminoacyl-histidine dipeptidase [Lachnospiraceae bacterium]
MSRLENLEPKEVFHYFEEISQIPRPSYKEGKISDYLVKFAQDRNLTVYQDEIKNVVIIKEATKGYENVEPIIIQGHMDMVCEKEPGYDIDMEKEGLTLQVEGDYLSAKGTTLGGDDGIAVAYALAILDSDKIEHPRLEVIITVCEEVGMDGATALDTSMITGKRVLNLDSEEEGKMLVSCAGGCTTICTLPVSFVQANGQMVSVKVSGLLGGHSGNEIDKQRGNSNQLMGRFLCNLQNRMDIQIVKVNGGAKDNAIPRETNAELMIAKENANAFLEEIKKFQEIVKKEYQVSDPEIRIEGELLKDTNAEAMSLEDSRKVVFLLVHLPGGIQRMSMDIKGLVETSLNMGILSTKEKEVSMTFSVRSSLKSQKEFLVAKLKSMLEFVGGSISIRGDYPAWEYKQDSAFRNQAIAVYKRMYGEEPVIEAIHAGLECGILASKIEDFDCVSTGPDMFDIHTTEERLSISSAKRVWEYVLEILKCK